nr:nucleolar and coiled-body phosphoprotein 1-like [Solanum lycopersicum]
MSKRGNETPRKSRRLNEEASSDDFHAPSFKILSQTQSQPSYVKVKSRSVKSTTGKKTNKHPKENEKKRKGKEKKKEDESEKTTKERGMKRKGKEIEESSESESDFVEELIKSKSKKPRASGIDTSHLQEEEETVKPKKSSKEKKTQTHLSSCINMNVFADLLTFLGQDKFQQFLDETPFGFFYNLHHIKIQCQLLRHLFMMGGSVYSRKVKEAIDKFATMVSLFLTSTGFYGKRLDLYAYNLPDYQ